MILAAASPKGQVLGQVVLSSHAFEDGLELLSFDSGKRFATERL